MKLQLQSPDLVPVYITDFRGDLVIVWHTPEEYARLMKGVDTEACRALNQEVPHA